MIKVGIIGAGRIGRVHITSITTRVPDAVIKTVADPFLNDETAAWAKSMGVEHTTKDYKEIINDPEIAAVLICSSTDTHSPISVEAIKAGKHVFCEKPIDHDIAKIKEVINALEGTNLKYQVGFNRRFDHNFESLQQAVAAGKVGKPEIIKITSRDPEPPSIDYVKVSGGMFLDMTIHDFDMARFLAGCDATEVYVQSANLVDPAIGRQEMLIQLLSLFRWRTEPSLLSITAEELPMDMIREQRYSALRVWQLFPMTASPPQ